VVEQEGLRAKAAARVIGRCIFCFPGLEQRGRPHSANGNRLLTAGPPRQHGISGQQRAGHSPHQHHPENDAIDDGIKPPAPGAASVEVAVRLDRSQSILYLCSSRQPEAKKPRKTHEQAARFRPRRARAGA
jgi:hypothetical protein